VGNIARKVVWFWEVAVLETQVPSTPMPVLPEPKKGVG
jgi:hypothetical protein